LHEKEALVVVERNVKHLRLGRTAALHHPGEIAVTAKLADDACTCFLCTCSWLDCTPLGQGDGWRERTLVLVGLI
jgi:hypothetical protein